MNSYYESTPTSPRPGALIPMEVPRVGEYFDVYVTYAASPSNFAVSRVYILEFQGGLKEI